MNTLPKLSWGEPSDQQPIYFAHANGFPPSSYQPIIDALAEQREVVSYLQRPLWQPTPDPGDLKNWSQLADDVTAFFDQNNMKNVVAVGHSLGSVTAFMAAQKRPDLFKALVMIEPVAFSRWFCGLIKVMPWLFKKRVPIIKKALNRPDHFNDIQAAFDFHRRPRVFKRINDAHLWHYIRAAFYQQSSGDVRLVFPRDWEAHIYATVGHFRNQLLKSKLPILAMRGSRTDTLSAKFWSKWKTNQNHQFVDFPNNGHLLPLENSGAVIESLLPFVEQHLS